MSTPAWRGRFTGIAWEVTRRGVAITGTVTDALTHAPIAGARVVISAGPPAFESLRASLARDPGWERQAERLDRRLSRVDGRYFFMSLPAGAYRLAISAPPARSRYGTAVLENVTVAALSDPDPPITPARADAALSPTRVVGRVTYTENTHARPIAGAKVRLRGDTTVVLTDGNGAYQLSGLVAGTPTVEVAARGFGIGSRATSLEAGQEQVVDIELRPAQPG